MARLSSPDPLLIAVPSTPARSSSSLTANSRVSRLSTPPSNTSSTRQEFWVQPPSLPSAEKRKYVRSSDAGSPADDLDSVQAILGEYKEGLFLYYFARHEDGQVHKHYAKDLKTRHPALVEAYAQSKADGTLPPFDPSALSVHARSRVKLTMTLPARRGRKTPVDSDAEIVPETESESEDGEDDDFEDDAGPARRSTRGASHKKALPYSPKKTRTRKVYTVDSDDDDDEQHTPTKSITVRKSSRARKSVRESLNDDDYMDVDGNESDESDYEQSTSKKRDKGKGKVTRKRASQPAYGYIRPVADLEYDDSDTETAPLRAHRENCEKCYEAPAHILASKKRKGKKPKREEFEEDDEEHIQKLGGWIRCLKCPVTAHWGCLASTQKAEILKAAQERDRARAVAENEARGDFDPTLGIKRRPTLDVYETTEFVCGSCNKGGICMGCMETVAGPEVRPHANSEDANGDAEMADAPIAHPDMHISDELFFRCLTCKRLAHYAHLPVPPGNADDVASIATYYQHETDWLCSDCSSYTYSLDKILAWRPYPPGAPQPAEVNYKANLPREYLVKWVDRSYRRTTWVPHMWLVSTAPAKLKYFLAGGSKVKLLDELPDAAGGEGGTATDFVMGESDEAKEPSAEASDEVPTTAYPDAERRIPPAWKTVDRVLDIRLWAPGKELERAKRRSDKKKGMKAAGSKRRVVSDDEDGDVEAVREEYDEQREAAYQSGEQPDDKLIEMVDEWEKRTRMKLTVEDADHVVWAFFKWEDLGYEESTWDSPPRPTAPEYPAFLRAFGKFVATRDVRVPSKPTMKDNRPRDEYRRKWRLKDDEQPQLGQDPNLKLMDFQIQGLNWLCNNWWNLQQCILADEMGLGKTVQIATFIGTLVERWNVFPALVVVPNSTLTNWIREFERWAPKLRVVPFFGEAKARDVIRDFELGDSRNYHVLVTTYESLNNGRDFTSVFKVGRWEVLVVDEGQRLKSDSSLTFRKLKELKTTHRILMTGTPLNNNIRELFNLMNFLDPGVWNDLPALEKEYEELNEELVKQLHNKLRPYFLRRTKSEVLPLPPKNEVIVPVSMAPLQKQIYKSILSQNLDLLKSLTQGSNAKADSSKFKTNMNNMLMQLRKCLQHPYLVSEDIEPKNLSPELTQSNLIDASAKLRLLKTMLPKLRARGHRVLLFSQFVIALNIVEDFLNGEGIKYLRLDGNTKQAERQKGMDIFNKEGSDVFIYLLTTRAGGVGINLWSADTVIIFDPDFNPHQDLQAIARAYRYGQKKTCLVFKLMVKSSAEDRIMQTGKKKLILDHLIVQKMDDEDDGGDDLKSILTYGAKALFEEESEEAKDIVYTDQDIDKLIEKTETEGEQTEVDKTANLQFSFAKVWAADKDDLEEIQEETGPTAEPADSWAQTLQRLAEEQEKQRAEEKVGRGARRKAAITAAKQIDIAAPTAKKHKKKGQSPSVVSEDSDFSGSGSSAGSDSDTASPDSEDFALAKAGKAKLLKENQLCGLCGLAHGAGNCYMTESSENLAEYRYMLLVHGDDEPPHERRAAIQVIEETLHKRGAIHLIRGQPLHLIEPRGSKSGIRHVETTGVGGSTAGPSKRPPPADAGPEIPKKKKKRKKRTETCVVCDNGTSHELDDCPIVKLGPTSVSRQIVRVEKIPGHEHTVDALRKILKKQKKRQAEAAQSSDPPVPMTSDV